MIGAACRLGTLLLALTVAGCGAAAPTDAIPPQTPPSGSQGPAAAVRVTLGIFSGRDDPSWILTPDEAAALDRALGELPRAVAEPPEGGLGYRGFTIERAGGTLVAYRGVVAPPGQGRRDVLSDPARTVERLLVESARAHVGAAELAEVRRSLALP